MTQGETRHRFCSLHNLYRTPAVRLWSSIKRLTVCFKIKKNSIHSFSVTPTLKYLESSTICNYQLSVEKGQFDCCGGGGVEVCIHENIGVREGIVIEVEEPYRLICFLTRSWGSLKTMEHSVPFSLLEGYIKSSWLKSRESDSWQLT